MHPVYTAVEYMATVHLHGGVVRYLRHALLWAHALVERVGILAGNDAILDGRAWERTYVFSYPCAYNRWLQWGGVYYSLHFNMAVDRMWKILIKDSIGRNGWVPNLYFSHHAETFTVRISSTYG